MLLFFPRVYPAEIPLLQFVATSNPIFINSKQKINRNSRIKIILFNINDFERSQVFTTFGFLAYCPVLTSRIVAISSKSIS